VGDFIVLPHTEMYGEPFGIPVPDEQIFISNFAGGEVFRSGNIWNRGTGKVFYFRPGHESYPIYKDEKVLRVIANAVKYVAPTCPPVKDTCPNNPMGWWEKA
jgi:trehalose utilization protein